jgi:transposase
MNFRGGIMLNLSEFNIIKQEENEYFYRFTVETKEPPFMCLNCGCTKLQIPEDGIDIGREIKFSPHQAKERIVSDISIHAKPVKLIIRHRRYKCSECSGTFYEWLDSIDRNDKVTKRLKDHIKVLALQKPFTHIADEYDISHTTVKRYFEEYVAEQEEGRVIKAPKILGIDEAHLNKTMRGVFTDIGNRLLLDITKDNTKRTVKATIQAMEGYEDIEVVTMDMYSGYKYAVNELIPSAFVVIDKFHVVQYAQRALDSIRIQVKKGLPKKEQRLLTYDRWVLLKNKEDLQWSDIEKRNTWFKLFPVLEQAYWLKEGLRDIYRLSKNKEEALERFSIWETAIPDNFKEFKDLKKTYNNHKLEIFNYFDKQYTNAYTESINNVIKQVEKNGKGYSFEVLRAKVLYGTQATKKRPKYDGSMEFHPMHYSFENYNDFSAWYDEAQKEMVVYGVDLTTLSEILERGEF